MAPNRSSGFGSNSPSLMATPQTGRRHSKLPVFSKKVHSTRRAAVNSPDSIVTRRTILSPANLQQRNLFPADVVNLAAQLQTTTRNLLSQKPAVNMIQPPSHAAALQMMSQRASQQVHTVLNKTDSRGASDETERPSPSSNLASSSPFSSSDSDYEMINPTVATEPSMHHNRESIGQASTCESQSSFYAPQTPLGDHKGLNAFRNFSHLRAMRNDSASPSNHLATPESRIPRAPSKSPREPSSSEEKAPAHKTRRAPSAFSGSPLNMENSTNSRQITRSPRIRLGDSPTPTANSRLGSNRGCQDSISSGHRVKRLSMRPDSSQSRYGPTLIISNDADSILMGSTDGLESANGINEQQAPTGIEMPQAGNDFGASDAKIDLENVVIDKDRHRHRSTHSITSLQSKYYTTSKDYTVEEPAGILREDEMSSSVGTIPSKAVPRQKTTLPTPQTERRALTVNTASPGKSSLRPRQPSPHANILLGFGKKAVDSEAIGLKLTLQTALPEDIIESQQPFEKDLGAEFASKYFPSRIAPPPPPKDTVEIGRMMKPRIAQIPSGASLSEQKMMPRSATTVSSLPRLVPAVASKALKTETWSSQNLPKRTPRQTPESNKFSRLHTPSPGQDRQSRMLQTAPAVKEHMLRSRSKSRLVMSNIRGLFHRRSASEIDNDGDADIPPIPRIPVLTLPHDAKLLTVPVTPSVKPFDADDLGKTTSTALRLMDRAMQEINSVEKERLVSLAQVMVNAITNARDAERAMHQAEQSAKEARISYEMTRSSIVEIGRLCNRYNGF